MARNYRGLILSASAGTGHIRAAEAIEKVARMHPRISDVVNVDALTYTNKLFRDFYSKLYIQMVRSAPTFLGWWYDRYDEPWKTEQMRSMLNRLNTRPLIKMIRDLNPDFTICTHFLPAEIISYLIEKHEIETRLSIVVTDYDVHAMWLSRMFHHYFVALPEAKVHLEMMGLPSNRITVSGIPIDPAFGVRRRAAELRQGYGLDERPVLLVSAGALGVGPAEHIVRILGQLKTPTQVIVVCGKNEALKRKTDAAVAALKAPHLSFQVLGYTNEMPQWMAMATLLMGKPGGLTTAEATAEGLPMVIFHPIPGQEARNSDHLLENGAAIKCNNITTVAYKIDELFKDPIRLRRMSLAAKRLGHPNAARTVLNTLIDQFHLAPIQMDKDEREKMKEVSRTG